MRETRSRKMINFTRSGTSYLLCAILSLLISSSTGIRIVLTPSEAAITKKTGDQFVIKCQLEDADADSKPQWVKVTAAGEQPVPNSGSVYTRSMGPRSVVLMFTAAKQDDAGEYKCKSGDMSTSVEIKLHRSITFIDTPAVQNPIIGKDAFIKCRADADPKPVISWSKGEDMIAENGGRFTVTDDGDLKIPDFEEKDNGEYTCEAVQSEMGDMKSLKITVAGHVAPGTPNIDLVNKENWPEGVHEGATEVRLSCMASGVPSPIYTWSKDGNEIENDHYFVNKTSGTLMFKVINRDDSGTYRCQAKNVVNTTSAEYKFTVYEKPRVEKIESKQAMVGNDVQFECVFAGTSPLTPEWLYAGQVIPAKAKEETTESDMVEPTGKMEPKKYMVVEENKAILYLNDIDLKDAGEYQCQVSNKAGTANEKTSLFVQRAPLIVSSTPNKKVRGIMQTEYDLYCEVWAVPMATFTWMKDGQEVQASPGQIELVTRNTTESGDHVVGTLKIIPMSDSDFGKYQCRASNGIEPDGTETIELMKIETPMEPELSCGAEQKPTIVTLTISSYSSAVPENQWPDDVNIVVSNKDEKLTVAALKFVESGVYKIPKLDPSVAYFFDVTGKNNAGTSPSARIECSTTAPAPPGIPAFTSPDPIQCNSTQHCTISWTLEDTGGKEITKFHIKYRPIVKEGEPEEQFHEEFIDGNTYSFTFTNLKPQTTYEVQLRALNEEGWGDVATTKIITPEASTPSITDVFTSADGPGAGAIVGIVIFIVLLIIVLVDLACYFVNQCGLLMCICVNLCGKTPPEVQKSKEAMIEGGVSKETKIDETYEQKMVLKEQVVTERLERTEDGTNESTPMISGGQNGHHERKDTTV